uniref:AB hydrolase-1 domain-containing protein n=1 Tax=Steinernema glaseri TaxID=37863 RepID=A0A1I7ZN09_9BILA
MRDGDSLLRSHFISLQMVHWSDMIFPAGVLMSEPVSESGSWFSLLCTPDNWPEPTWVISAILTYFAVRFLNVFSYPEKAEVTTAGKSKIDEGGKASIGEVLDKCDILKKVYDPPLLWGRNGHFQTAVYGILGHTLLKRSFDRRHVVRLEDSTSVTFDVFEPITAHSSNRDYTLVLTPGIANSSESNYIRTAVHYAQEAGYRCAVLNHLGALADVELTSDHIFSYGGTLELEAMMERLASTYPETKFISIGFSMGANITTRYLHQVKDSDMADRIISGLSVCLGYCALASTPMYHDWEHGRRAYNYIITENMKRLLRRNYEKAVAPHVRSGLVDEQRLWASTSVVSLDEHYNRRIHGFPSLEEFYRWCSSLPLIPSLKIPMVFMNALDDPIVPEKLWQPVKEICAENTNLAFILTKHGGHLGFLEGRSVAPNSVTWLDRFIVEYADAAIETYDQ